MVTSHLRSLGIGSEDYRSFKRIKSLWNIALQLVDSSLLLSTIVAGVYSVLIDLAKVAVRPRWPLPSKSYFLFH